MRIPSQNLSDNLCYGYEDVEANENGVDIEEPQAPSSQMFNYTAQENRSNSNNDEDFAEYMWMENLEEFDKQVLQELEEQELVEQCLQFMADDGTHTEQRTNGVAIPNSRSQNNSVEELTDNFKLDLVDVTNSTLNPLAAEFVPENPSDNHEL